jgi:predicted glycosyltransferase
MRRNLLIAQTIAGAPLHAATLLIIEAQQAVSFAIPPGVDTLTLPALRKALDGQVAPRSLEISLQKLIAMRARAILGALEAFEPDVLIVDHLPRGAVMELDPTLEFLRRGGHTRCVLGLRDVLEAPETVQREWKNAANEDAIRDYYDAVWVYSDPKVCDHAREYHFSPEVAQKLRYTGYLDQRKRADSANSQGDELIAPLGLPRGRLALCLVGGGQDGARLAEAFAEADLPPGVAGVIATGPFMPPEVLRRLRYAAARNPQLRVLDFVAEPTLLLSRAERVIAMGGYNTVCEVLSFAKHALIVPRATPRREQLIRAERLRDLGLLDVLPADDISPGALTSWLARDLWAPPRVRARIDLGGLARLPHLLEDVLAAPPPALWKQRRDAEDPAHRYARQRAPARW